jgi:hypothetical protein
MHTLPVNVRVVPPPRLVSGTNLKNGSSTRCSDCANSSEAHAGQNNGNWKGDGIIPGKYIYRVKHRAITEGYDLTITSKDMLDQYIKQHGACALTNLPIKFDDNTASLDRIDSNRGYEVDNIQWVHKDVNLMKNHFDQGYFIRICKLIAQHNK